VSGRCEEEVTEKSSKCGKDHMKGEAVVEEQSSMQTGKSRSLCDCFAERPGLRDSTRGGWRSRRGLPYV